MDNRFLATLQTLTTAVLSLQSKVDNQSVEIQRLAGKVDDLTTDSLFIRNILDQDGATESLIRDIAQGLVSDAYAAHNGVCWSNFPAAQKQELYSTLEAQAARLGVYLNRDRQRQVVPPAPTAHEEGDMDTGSLSPLFSSEETAHTSSCHHTNSDR
ncbi:hypothetical protein IWQ62_002910 [Dispira parvispora]|uniref:Uncharacterized protein n=1 Tax=Dispira parvispora TaxID=1520584 RepID=A0A9W8APF4_9FUNG|nr:hypothetical protein IWQ62_002910 [Dispira parvispora]